MHMGPEAAGHLGDLPLITVGADGVSKQMLKASRITSVADIKGHAIMIHAGGDNYADTPAPLGGGGARMACGVAQ
jgi:Cu-Zn family superoxide dismutase